MPVRYQRVSIKGKQVFFPAFRVGPKTIIITMGKFLKVSTIHDEFWLNPKDITNPIEVIAKLKVPSNKPDLFKFEQKIPDVTPRYNYYLELDNRAVIRIDSYQHWFKNQINRGARKAIKKSKRQGVITKIIPFTDHLVNGICSIYNETPIRQGKKFWHYNKPFSVVKSDNSSYLESSLFVGAYYDDELIGFIKLVIYENVANLMQILSKVSHYDKNPTNALLSKAVEICEDRNIRFLTYGKYYYDDKKHSSLVDFKRHNGFEKIDIPVYYVPLTVKGQVALRIGLHKGWKNIIPNKLRKCFINLRSKYR